MGIMSKLLGKSDEKEQIQAAVASAECPHTTLTPRWDSVDDIGHEDRATAFRCEGCGTMFTRAEAAQLRASASDRLRDTVATEH
jgi:hypothetical protein